MVFKDTEVNAGDSMITDAIVCSQGLENSWVRGLVLELANTDCTSSILCTDRQTQSYIYRYAKILINSGLK